ncbi:hypothetical protein R6Q57_029322, partial [Mikania cordata]
GDKIQATIKKILMCAFENQLEEGNIILLSRFGVGEMNFKYPVIKHPFRLNFCRQTNIKRCLEFDGPLYGFRFIDFHQIINKHVMPANCGEGSSHISSQTVYSSREEFLSRNVRKYVKEVFDLSKVGLLTISNGPWNE